MIDTAPGRDRLLILGAAVLFSTGGTAVKLASLNAWQVACFRSAVAVLAIVILIPATRRRWSRKVWLVGTAYAATMILFVFANKLTTAASAIFLQGTAPLYVLLLSPLLLGEAIRPRQVGFMALIAGGMICFFVGSDPVSPIAAEPVTGNLLAAGSGLSYALLIMGLRSFGKTTNDPGVTITVVVCGNFLAAVVCAPMAFPVASSSSIDWAAVLFLGVFQIGLAYAMLTRGIARVAAVDASLILIAEPVLSPVWASIVHGETPTVWAMIGGAVILSVTTAMTLSDGKRA